MLRPRRVGSKSKPAATMEEYHQQKKEYLRQLQEPKEETAFSVAKLQAQVYKLLKLSTFEPEQRYWLNTGSADLNAVMGSPELGIPYGKIIELAGPESAGKTSLSLILGAMAQKDGAGVGRMDLEDSRDEPWDKKMGLDPSQVYNINPRILVNKKGKPTRLQAAEELFEEAELVMARMSRHFKKQFWLIDSVANIQTEMAVDAGTNGNMRTRNDRPMFLAETLPRWAGLAANYNAMIFLVNQLRTRPGAFGDPRYTPGGRALKHACSIVAWIDKYPKRGLIKKAEVTIGIIGTIKNQKNKVGAGGYQNAKCGFKIKWQKSPATCEFMTYSDAKEYLAP